MELLKRLVEKSEAGVTFAEAQLHSHELLVHYKTGFRDGLVGVQAELGIAEEALNFIQGLVGVWGQNDDVEIHRQQMWVRVRSELPIEVAKTVYETADDILKRAKERGLI